MNLLNEIIGNRALLTPEDNNTLQSQTLSPMQKFVSSVFRIAKSHFAAILSATLILIAGVAVLVRLRSLSQKQKPRARILSASARMYRALKSQGKRPSKNQTSKTFILSLESPEALELYALEQKAKFAPLCEEQDALRAEFLAINLLKKRKHGFHIMILLVFFLCSGITVIQGEARPRDTEASSTELLSRAQNAILAENWETAISILSEGITRYPTIPDFRKALGTLYLDQGLYDSAYKELNKALALGYTQPVIYSNLSDAAGYLNRDEESLGFLKKFLDSSPSDLFAWSNFGWLCYKTHRINEGIAALQHVAETYGPDGNLYVGLANLYTAAFDYVNAKKYYTLAIKIAVERHQPYLSSIYYYNRSILEEVFYNFSDAYDDTIQSIQQSPRSSGYLMQGELELRKLDFKKAFAQYLKAYSLDSTPLAAIGIADTLLQSGHPAEALRYINAISSKNDLSWIANYGTTPNQYLAEFGKIQRDYYIFQSNREKRMVIHSFSTLLTAIQNRISNAISLWYHDTLFRIQNTHVARHYAQANSAMPPLKGQKLFINSYYFLAFDKWRQTAISYLDTADKIETEYIPAAKPSYLYEKGKLTHKIDLISESIISLDPVWEKETLAKALAERIKLVGNSNPALKMKDCIRLFDLNPSAFIYYDIPLPVFFEFGASENKNANRNMRRLSKMLMHAGFQQSLSSPIHLGIQENDSAISLVLTNRNSNSTIYSQIIHKTAHYQQEMPDFVNRFSTGTFSTNLGLSGLP